MECVGPRIDETLRTALLLGQHDLRQHDLRQVRTGVSIHYPNVVTVAHQLRDSF